MSRIVAKPTKCSRNKRNVICAQRTVRLFTVCLIRTMPCSEATTTDVYGGRCFEKNSDKEKKNWPVCADAQVYQRFRWSRTVFHYCFFVREVAKMHGSLFTGMLPGLIDLFILIDAAVFLLNFCCNITRKLHTCKIGLFVSLFKRVFDTCTKLIK